MIDQKSPEYRALIAKHRERFERIMGNGDAVAASVEFHTEVIADVTSLAQRHLLDDMEAAADPLAALAAHVISLEAAHHAEEIVALVQLAPALRDAMGYG